MLNSKLSQFRQIGEVLQEPPIAYFSNLFNKSCLDLNAFGDALEELEEGRSDLTPYSFATAFSALLESGEAIRDRELETMGWTVEPFWIKSQRLRLWRPRISRSVSPCFGRSIFPVLGQSSPPTKRLPRSCLPG